MFATKVQFPLLMTLYFQLQCSDFQLLSDSEIDSDLFDLPPCNGVRNPNQLQPPAPPVQRTASESRWEEYREESFDPAFI